VTGRRADRSEHCRAQLVTGRPPQGAGPVQDPPVTRVAGEMLAQSRADAEHAAQAKAQRRVRPKCRAQFRGGGHQPREAGQGKVGIGCRGQRAEQAEVRAFGVQPDVLGEQPKGPVGVGEAHQRQLPGQRPARHTHLCTVSALVSVLIFSCLVSTAEPLAAAAVS